MIAAAIGIRVAVFSVIALTIMKARPSTLVRVAEDGVLNVGTRVKGFARRTKVEYKARMYAKATEAIRKADADFEGMSPAQRAQATRDEAAILARSVEILAARNGIKSARSGTSRANRRSSSAGHEA